MTTRAAVEEFFSDKRLAVVGASASGKGFGAAAYGELKKKGFEVFPVHPEAETIGGDKAFGSLGDLPDGVKRLLIVLPPAATEKIVEQAAAAGLTHVWMQQGAESEAAVRACEEQGLTEVHGECVLMFADPVGLPHNIHRWVWGVIGKLPK